MIMMNNNNIINSNLLPPDLSLASSYVPACFCLGKSLVCFMLFLFSPVRGWIALGSLLLADRVLWNQMMCSSSSSNNSNMILDVNAVCVALVGGLMVMHVREDGIKSAVMPLGIIGLWSLLSALQILGTVRLPGAVEVLLAACCVSVLSCLFQAREIGEVMALRSFVFVMANVVLPYLGVLLQNVEVNTPYIIVCRTLPILLGGPELACAWVAVYVLCMGYQVRRNGSGGSRGGGKQQMRYSPEPQQQQQQSGSLLQQVSVVGQQQCGGGAMLLSSSVSCSSSSSSSASEEASLLREALARKQCSGGGGNHNNNRVGLIAE